MGNLLKGQVAIITGSGQGIGKDLALWMASQGCKVITNNRKKGSSMQAHDGKFVVLNEQDKAKLSAIIGDAESAAAQVNANPDVIAAGGEAYPVYADVSTPEGCKKLVDAAIEKWGRLDILVNNAAATWTGNIKEMKPENWETCVRSKLDSSFYLIYSALPHMLKQGYGRILLASSEGQVGLAGMCGYSAACGGVAAMTRGIAQDLADDGISINAYTPNAGTRSWFNMLAEYRAEGIDPSYIEAAAPAAQKYPPGRMIPVLGYMCTREFDATGLVVKVGADGEVSLWTSMDKYNTMFKDLWQAGAWTVEELREWVPKELLKDAQFTRSALAVNKGSYT